MWTNQSEKSSSHFHPKNNRSWLQNWTRLIERLQGNSRRSSPTTDGPRLHLSDSKPLKLLGLILIHSPDHNFQQKLLPTLEDLLQQRKIMGEDIATLIDKMLIAAGTPQRFGTQFSWRGDDPMVMDPVEDPSQLDQRRAMYSLPPMDLYKRSLAAMYHRMVK
jgi:hypothetical protein